MKVLFEGGPHDGGLLDIDPDLEYIRLHGMIPASATYDPCGPIKPPEVRVYAYKRWEIRYLGDGRVEIRYCLLGTKPRV